MYVCMSNPSPRFFFLSDPEDMNAVAEYTLKFQRRIIYTVVVKVADFNVDITSGLVEAQVRFWLRCIALKSTVLRNAAARAEESSKTRSGEVPKAVVLLVFTHRDCFRGHPDRNAVHDFLSQMTTRAFFHFSNDIDFLVDHFEGQQRPYFYMSLCDRSAYKHAAAFVSHIHAITPLVLRSYQKPISSNCLAGLKWVQLWRQRMSAGDMMKIKYKPRSADELESFLHIYQSRKLTVRKVRSWGHAVGKNGYVMKKTRDMSKI